MPNNRDHEEKAYAESYLRIQHMEQRQHIENHTIDLLDFLYKLDAIPLSSENAAYEDIERYSLRMRERDIL